MAYLVKTDKSIFMVSRCKPEKVKANYLDKEGTYEFWKADGYWLELPIYILSDRFKQLLNTNEPIIV